MRGPCFITITLGVEIQRRLNTGMTQDALHGLGIDLPLFTNQLESECRRLCRPKRWPGLISLPPLSEVPFERELKYPWTIGWSNSRVVVPWVVQVDTPILEPLEELIDHQKINGCVTYSGATTKSVPRTFRQRLHCYRRSAMTWNETVESVTRLFP